MLSKEEIEFRSSLEKMFNYLKNKKELTEFEKLVIINFDYITKKVLSPECKTATEIVSKTMYYELIKRKEEYYEKQIDQLESDKQKLIEKLEEDIVNITKTMQDGKHCDDYSRCRLKAYRTKTKEILSILKGE